MGSGVAALSCMALTHPCAEAPWGTQSSRLNSAWLSAALAGPDHPGEPQRSALPPALWP